MPFFKLIGCLDFVEKFGKKYLFLNFKLIKQKLYKVMGILLTEKNKLFLLKIGKLNIYLQYPHINTLKSNSNKYLYH